MRDKGFTAMSDAANGCPACILSVIRTLNHQCPDTGAWYVSGPDDGRNEWSYANAKREWWENVNAAALEAHS